MTKSDSRPVILLVRPQMGENIGAAARAMMNFGLTELRLVAPRDGWPNEKAYSMAAHATPILDRAKLFSSLEDAIADLRTLYATTARSREIVKPVISVRTAMGKIPAKAGIMFGPERTGLTNEEMALCDALITIPTAPDNASLNVAQSLVIVAYEWFAANLPLPPGEGWGEGLHDDSLTRPTTSAKASPVAAKDEPPASKAEIQGFFDQLEAALDDANFFKSPGKRAKMWLNLRNLFMKAQLSGQDVRTLRGVIRSLVEGQ